MIVIIAGSREITDTVLVLDIIDKIVLSGWEITGVISGCARGVDTCALMKPWACAVRKMPADWKPDGRLDRSAGYRRNVEMANAADALVAIWDGKSRGTLHMIECMRLRNKLYQVFYEDGFK